MPYLRAFLFALGVAVLVLLAVSNTTPTYTPYQMAGVVLWHTFVGYCLGYHVEVPTAAEERYNDPVEKSRRHSETYRIVATDPGTWKEVGHMWGVPEEKLSYMETKLRESCARQGYQTVNVAVEHEQVF